MGKEIINSNIEIEIEIEKTQKNNEIIRINSFLNIIENFHNKLTNENKKYFKENLIEIILKEN